MIISHSSSSSLLEVKCAKAAHRLHVSRTCPFFCLYSRVKVNILEVSPQALTKMTFTACNNGVWNVFIYCADDLYFKINLYNFWGPERTPILQQS
jgi:hypothetical protein